MKPARRSVSTFESLETRRHLSASAVKVVDSGGPVEQVIEASGQVIVSSRHQSGSGISQIYIANGTRSKTRLLVDLSQPGATISSIADLTATDDGRVYFTANAAGGRHLFQLNTKKGGFTQITAGQQVFYTRATAAGNRLFVYESNGQTLFTLDTQAGTLAKVVTLRIDSPFTPAGETVYFIGPNEALYRTDGTGPRTVIVSANLKVGRADFFATNDHVYFESRENNLTSLYRTSASSTAPQKLAEDFTIDGNTFAELDDHVYFAGFYFSTSPLSKGRELYRARISDGQVELAADVSNASGGSGIDSIHAIGNSIYFTNSDGEFLPSQGTGDRELYRFDTVSKKTTLVTKNNTLYPVGIGGGVLGSYYFVAAPDKENARFGSRVLYVTDPVTDKIEVVPGQPVVKDSDGDPLTDVKFLNVGSRGLFFTASTADFSRDTDVYFVSTPFSRLDPKTTILTIQATDSTDTVTMTVIGNELVVTLNGIEERHELAKVKRIEAFLKEGNDTFTSDTSVAVDTYVFGDLGDDLITTGAGDDTITGGAGKNTMFGGAGDDRVNGSNGKDSLDGQEGNDRLYGKGGNDDLTGGAGVDRLFGDEMIGPFGADILRGGTSNDKLYGYGGNDTLVGLRQDDLLFGGDGDDLLIGGDGNDTLDGEAGVDTLQGELGDDTFRSKDNTGDVLDGGEGTDTAFTDGTEKAISLIEELK
jgi:Ca2+-binding RTX toxin-like protein